MDRTISATVDAAPVATMEALADLSTYSAWLSLVAAAEPDGPDVWLVTLRARLGPLSRSKRLRMIRTELLEHSVRFERAGPSARGARSEPCVVAWTERVVLGAPAT